MAGKGDKVKVGGQERPPRGESPPRAARTPRSGAGSGGGSSSGAPAAPRPDFKGEDRKLHAAVSRFYSTLGMGMAGFASMSGDVGLAASGVNITSQAEATADAWVELAQANPRVKQALQGFVQGSTMANLIGCHVAMVVPVLATRGVIPGEVATMFLSDEAKQAAQQMAQAQQAAQQAAQAQAQTAPPAAA